MFNFVGAKRVFRYNLNLASQSTLKSPNLSQIDLRNEKSWGGGTIGGRGSLTTFDRPSPLGKKTASGFPRFARLGLFAGGSLSPSGSTCSTAVKTPRLGWVGAKLLVIYNKILDKTERSEGLDRIWLEMKRSVAKILGNVYILHRKMAPANSAKHEAIWLSEAKEICVMICLICMRFGDKKRVISVEILVLLSGEIVW